MTINRGFSPGASDRIGARLSVPDTSHVNIVVQWAFYGFVFSIPLEYPARTIPVEVHTITGSLFLLISLIQPGTCYRRAPAALLWLLAYLGVYIVLSLFSTNLGEAIKLFFNLLLVGMLFWVSANLLRREALAKAALVSFVLGCVVVALLLMLNIETGTLDSGDSARRMIFGQDPNTTGGNMALGIVALIGLAYNRERSGFLRWLPALGVGAALAGSLMLTGSRGALLALAVGLLAFMIKSGDARTVAKSAIIGIVAIGTLTWAAVNSDAMRERSLVALEKGNMAGRELIYPEAWAMFLEKPLLGWGPVDNMYELGSRLIVFKRGKLTANGLPAEASEDTHNLLLDVMTATGLFGTVPLLMCIGLCMWAAWIARAGPHGTTPFALLTVVLVLSMDANWSASKQAWVLFGYAAACSSLMVPFTGTRTAHLRRSQIASRAWRPAH